MYYKWILYIYGTGEMLESSRFYSTKIGAERYLEKWIINHHVRPYEERWNSIIHISIDLNGSKEPPKHSKENDPWKELKIF